MINYHKYILAATLALASVSAPVMAETVFIGNPTGGSNSFPFGGGAGANTRYQQVYNQNSFAGIFSITGIQFRRNSGTTLNSGIYDLNLSTTAKSVNGLSNIFDDNRGADNALLFSGTLLPNFDGTLLTFNLTNAFSFDPGAGNLLVDFSYAGPTDGNSFFDANNGDANGLFSRAHDFGSTFNDWGLQTTFVGTFAAAVPEPATWMMLILGFGLIGGAIRRSPAQVRVRFA